MFVEQDEKPKENQTKEICLCETFVFLLFAVFFWNDDFGYLSCINLFLHTANGKHSQCTFLCIPAKFVGFALSFYKSLFPF